MKQNNKHFEAMILKKYIFATFSFFLLLSAACSSRGEKPAQETAAAPSDTAVIEFTEYEHDFGKITAGEKVAAIFTFKNTGKAPLTISMVTTSCGCTASSYSNEPVLPGKTGTIEVVFNSSGYDGMQRKTITVRSNASNPYVMLQIKAEVISGNNN